MSYGVCCAARLLSYPGVEDLNKVPQVKGVRCATQLKFLESEPKKCKPSPSCPLAHQDKAFIWFLGSSELVLFEQCSSVCSQTTASATLGEYRMDRYPGRNPPTSVGPDLRPEFLCQHFDSSFLFLYYTTYLNFLKATRIDSCNNILEHYHRMLNLLWK